MQKIVLIIAMFGLVNAQELTPSEVSSLRNYSHSLSGKLRHQRLLQRTAVIKKDTVYTLVKEECKCEPYLIKLSVRSNRLFYTVYSEQGSMKIDALDGEIMQKCQQ
jgi:hypothetical protein